MALRTKDITVIQTMDALRDYLDTNGWWVSECSFGHGDIGWEVGQYSPAGEDFFFCFEHNNDVETAIAEIKRYAYDFDINEHVEMWVMARHSVSGVPDVVTLVEDAKAIQDMLDALADGCNWCEQSAIGEDYEEGGT